MQCNDGLLAWPSQCWITHTATAQHPSYHICKADQIDKDKSSTTMECELDFSLISASSLSLRYLHVIILICRNHHRASDHHTTS